LSSSNELNEGLADEISELRKNRLELMDEAEKLRGERDEIKNQIMKINSNDLEKLGFDLEPAKGCVRGRAWPVLGGKGKKDSDKSNDFDRRRPWGSRSPENRDYVRDSIIKRNEKVERCRPGEVGRGEEINYQDSGRLKDYVVRSPNNASVSPQDSKADRLPRKFYPISKTPLIKAKGRSTTGNLEKSKELSRDKGNADKPKELSRDKLPKRASGRKFNLGLTNEFSPITTTPNTPNPHNNYL
jgi:hypothetical protein